jgi:hypothetical protein
MLAMEVNDDAGSLTPRVALRCFASRLAPTGWSEVVVCQTLHRFSAYLIRLRVAGHFL